MRRKANATKLQARVFVWGKGCMKKKWKRFRKITYALSVVLCALVVSVSSSFFVSKADTLQEFYVNYAEPTCSSNQGYVNLLLYNIAEDYYAIRTFFWYTAASNSNGDLPIYAIVSTTKTSFTFNIGGNLQSGASVYYSLTQIGETGNYWNIRNSSSASYTVDLASQGWECRGMKYKGNVGQASQGAGYSLFQVNFSGDSDAYMIRSIYDVLLLHSGQNAEMIDKLTTIMNSSLSMKQKIEEIYKLDVKIENHLLSIKSYIEQYFPELSEKLDRVIEEQGYTNNWLEEILEKIKEMVDEASEEVKEKTEELEESNNSQGDTLDSLNQQNKTDKVDVGSASGSVDSYIDGTAISNYGTVLAVFTNDNNILKMIMTVLSVSLVAYVLFGKR